MATAYMPLPITKSPNGSQLLNSSLAAILPADCSVFAPSCQLGEARWHSVTVSTRRLIASQLILHDRPTEMLHPSFPLPHPNLTTPPASHASPCPLRHIIHSCQANPLSLPTPLVFPFPRFLTPVEPSPTAKGGQVGPQHAPL
jgi:hypothetical protein